MIARNNIQTDLIRLVSGERLLRVTELRLGLSLEKKLDARQPVARQKESLLNIFEAALAHAERIGV